MEDPNALRGGRRLPGWPLLVAAALVASLDSARAQVLLGDADRDGVLTVADVVRVLNLRWLPSESLPPETALAADADQNGMLNPADAAGIAAAVAEGRPAGNLPWNTIRETSPRTGEAGVAVTRETVLRFSQPLAATTVLTRAQVHATALGRSLLTRIELSDRRDTLYLFYLEPLPGNARVTVTFDGTGVQDGLGRPVDADGDGRPGGVRRIDFETLSTAPVPGTVVAGRVFASEPRAAGPGAAPMDAPLAGVTITVDGQEETLRTVTDALGRFRLDPAPSGAFFVHIDGRTVTNLAAGIRYPDQAYYPFVGKRWVAQPGQETMIGDVFLPLIPRDALITASPAQETVVTMPPSFVGQNPDWAGVALRVPPGALVSESGVRGGRIGLAAVAPDRLPGPLPLGVSPSEVITIQTDGPANFSRPVPVCFPNRPDPVTGERLPPGAASALWSFNHDTGRFEIVGSMTVSPDGRTICSDPGVGILAPGWHFTNPGSTVDGGSQPCGPGGPRTRTEPGSASHPAAQPGRRPCPRPGSVPRSQSGAGDPVQLFSGEFQEEVTDLWLPGRGFDFEWTRTYRSVTGLPTAQGNQWDHPYHLGVEAEGEDLALSEGTGRRDVYRRQTDGTWTRPEMFRVIRRAADGGFELTFPDRARWLFHPLDGSVRAGRALAIEDRFGNRMALAYDAAGRLATITDTLGHDIAIGYNADGFIASVTDHTGRQVRYAYYGAGDAGGGFGDLRSVTSPSVTGTSTGNDFPQGKTVTYTYTTGFADERLNHNLLTITDGRRNDPSDPTFGTGPYLVNYYAATTDPDDLLFDRVVRQEWGGAPIDITYLPMIPGALNGRAVQWVIVRDRVGNVSEHFFDAGNRLVRSRQFTGRSAIDRAVTLTDNRPTNPLRTNDPVWFESVYVYNDDSQLVSVTHPNGNRTEYVYESALDPSASALSRGNLRIVRRLPGTHQPVGDQPLLEERFEYDTGFDGCCGSSFVTRHTDPRGNVTRHEYDGRGNRIRTRHPVDGVVEDFEYNAFGQISAQVAPPDAAGRRRRTEYEYYADGPSHGWLRRIVADAGGLNLTHTFEYDAAGHVTRNTNARGLASDLEYNAWDQVVSVLRPEVTEGEPQRYREAYLYDANGNVRRWVHVSRRADGSVVDGSEAVTEFEFEMLNRIVRLRESVDGNRFLATEFGYDANRNRVLIRRPEAVAGRKPGAEVAYAFDERDLPFRTQMAPGTADQATHQFDYDPNGNLVRSITGLEDGGNMTRRTFDAYDRMVLLVDALGNRTTHRLDPHGNSVNVLLTGELNDEPGETGNIRLAEISRQFDPLDRLVLESAAHFDPMTGTDIGDGASSRTMEYSPDSRLIRVRNDAGHATTFRHDTAGRPVGAIDALGNEFIQSHDAAGNTIREEVIERSGLAGAGERFVTSFVFDPLDRLVRVVAPAGQETDYRYDSRGNLVEQRDGARAGPGLPGNRTLMTYDRLDRLVAMTRELRRNGTGNGDVIGEIRMTRRWDDDSRLVGVTDPNGNETRFEYDRRGWPSAIQHADGSRSILVHDVRGNLVRSQDPTGTIIETAFDRLERPVARTIVPGAGVAPTTTFERFAYDGLGQLSSASNNVSRVDLQRDSLGNLTRDVVNGIGAARTYDGLGNPVRTVYPSGRELLSRHDALTRLESITETTGGASRLVVSWSYLGQERVGHRIHGNGTRMDYEFDASRRPTRVRHRRADGSPIHDQTFGWDANDLRVEEREVFPNARHRVLSYDSAHRLQSIQFPGSADAPETYTLDAAGNRLRVEGGPLAGPYRLDPAPAPEARMNRYSATPSGTWAHDANGNLVGLSAGGSTLTLRYDFQDRLVEARDASGTTRYEYDALGRRIAKIHGEGAAAVVTRYHPLQRDVLEESDGNGAVTASLVHGLGPADLVSLSDGTGTLYLHPDDLLRFRHATDAAGQVVESYEYHPYGSPRITDGTGSPLDPSVARNRRLFAGYEYDAETGFYRVGRRYYAPQAGRFITRDPAGALADPMAVGNSYTYAGNSPSTFVDPTGLAASRASSAVSTVSRGLPGAPLRGAKALADQAEGLRDAATALRVQAGGMEDAIRRAMHSVYKEFVNGTFLEREVLANGKATGNYVATRLSPEDALRAVDSMFTGPLPNTTLLSNVDVNTVEGQGWFQKYAKRFYYHDTYDEVAKLNSQAASLGDDAARLSRGAGALRALGIIAVAVQTGLDAKRNYDNCASATTIVSDAAGTIGANALLAYAHPGVAIADALTGGSVSGTLGNAVRGGTLIGRVAVNDRISRGEQLAIQDTLTRSPVTRYIYRQGERFSNWFFGD